MGKGIGNQQKAIMKVVRENPGDLQDVYRRIKKALYPDVEFIEPIDYQQLIEMCSSAKEAIMWKDIKQNDLERQRKRLKNDPERSTQLNRIRVSVSTSVKGLVKRGYIKKEGNKVFINPNVVPRQNVRV